VSTPYYLAQHAHACVTNGQVVVLDIRRHKYIGIGRVSSALLASYVEGWPPMDEDGAVERKSADESARATVTKMERMGLITRDPAQAHTATTQTIMTPAARTLVQADLEDRPTVKWGFGLRMLQACLAAAWDLNLCRFEQVVSRLRGRKMERPTTASGCDQQALFSVVERYVYARPLFFSARNACLYDSRTLLELLYYHRIFPTWIFGVHPEPFQAHCWLQLGDLVVNDAVENVSRFTPILAI
jgi:hypothetical protein